MSSRSWESSGAGKSSAANEPSAPEFDFRHRSGKIGKTITLTEREVRAASQLLKALAGGQEPRRELAKIPDEMLASDVSHDRKSLAENARLTFANRALRSEFFNKDMFGEAAWDMLLALYVAEQSGTRHTVSGLASLSGVATTTALRWLDFLQTEELVARQSNPIDRRVFYVELTDKGREGLDAYFSATMTRTT
jgi:DNA-binding MarR family transcriptional regulator